MSALTYDRYARQPRLVGFWEFALIVWIPACLAVVPVVTRAGDGNRPVDLRELAVECASPFDVGNRAQLFVDRLLVHETQRVAFTLHPEKKHSRNPLVVCDKPWEGWRLEIYGSVIYDKEEQIFKMWYIGESPEDFPNYATHYATSQDGIHWKKPLVGTVESLRGGKHNAVAEGYLLASVIKDGADPDPGPAIQDDLLEAEAPARSSDHDFTGRTALDAGFQETDLPVQRRDYRLLRPSSADVRRISQAQHSRPWALAALFRIVAEQGFLDLD